MHAELVSRLEPRAGEGWLDVATGTGAVAVRAAQAGADVTGLDITPALLEQAGEAAAAAGVRLELVEGDAQRLPFDDASFDVVSSCFGVIFAPDRAAVAGELARVCRQGGRLGLTVWRPDAGFHALAERFLGERPTSYPGAWGEDGAVEGLLGGSFQLEVDEAVYTLDADSIEAYYEWATTAVPPMAAFMQRLEPARHAEFRDYFMDTHAGYVRPDGRVVEERKFLYVVGTRR